MTDTLSDLKPLPDDLVVVPEGMEVPEEVLFHVYKMKFLHTPSIIRSGGYSMGLLDKFTSSALNQLLGVVVNPKQDPLQNVSADEKRLTELGFVRKSDFEAVKTPLSREEIVQAYEAAGLGLNSDLNFDGRPSDVAKTDLPKFWRYSRPTVLINRSNGTQMVVSPKGGIAFYIELDAANKSFAFSFALCHTNDNFDYGRARQITKGRFDSGDWHEVKNYDERHGVVENIGVALTNMLYNRQADVNKETVFSSLSDKFSLVEFQQLHKRI